MSGSGFERTSESERDRLPPERKRIRLWPWTLLLMALLAVVAFRAGKKMPEPEQRGERDPAVGTQIKQFHLEPLTGDARPISETDLQGKVTLVNFWGPWCPACGIEFPHLVELEEHFRTDPNFQFLSVSTNADPLDERGLREGTEAFLQRQRAGFPTYRDPQAHTIRHIAEATKLEEFGFPATMLIDPDGVIRAMWIGYIPGDEKAVREAVEKSLAKVSKNS
jgi:thiol-disulfide isomerase/thioredoxin